jgi:hypothetical protein
MSQFLRRECSVETMFWEVQSRMTKVLGRPSSNIQPQIRRTWNGLNLNTVNKIHWNLNALGVINYNLNIKSRAKKMNVQHCNASPTLKCSATSQDSKAEKRKEVAMPPNTVPPLRCCSQENAWWHNSVCKLCSK